MKITKTNIREIIREELAKVIEVNMMDHWEEVGLGSLGQSWRNHLEQDTGGLIPMGVDKVEWDRNGKIVTITYWDRNDEEHEIDVDTSQPPATEKLASLRPELSDEEKFDAAMSDMDPAPKKPRGGFGLGENKKRKVKITLKENKDPNAKVRNRGDVVFSAESSKVKDDKDHFPINSEAQARNALARASQYSSTPGWYNGSLSDLVATVQRKVKAKYSGIETTDASKKPGKG